MDWFKRPFREKLVSFVTFERLLSFMNCFDMFIKTSLVRKTRCSNFTFPLWNVPICIISSLTKTCFKLLQALMNWFNMLFRFAFWEKTLRSHYIWMSWRNMLLEISFERTNFVTIITFQWFLSFMKWFDMQF